EPVRGRSDNGRRSGHRTGQRKAGHDSADRCTTRMGARRRRAARRRAARLRVSETLTGRTLPRESRSRSLGSARGRWSHFTMPDELEGAETPAPERSTAAPLIEQVASSGGADPDPATPHHEKLTNGGAVLFVVVLIGISMLALYAAAQVW